MPLKSIGVVGCGQMGSGIVLVCAQAGYKVIVSEMNDALLKMGLDGISASLARSAERGRITRQEKDDTFDRITGTTELKHLSPCDIIVEAVNEDPELKKTVISKLDAECPEDALLATNTSCLSVSEIARAASKPERVLGIHFFNPVSAMKLVEITRTVVTRQAALDTARDFVQSLGKTPVLTRDTPGFIVNRLAVPFMLDAMRLLEYGTAGKEDIDRAVMLGLNHPSGPFALADLIGLDVVLSMADNLYRALKDARYEAPELLRKMVKEGLLGRKSRKGFYEYK
jgi:3-hydroxybutyryl-CoA dehydrogenase